MMYEPPAPWEKCFQCGVTSLEVKQGKCPNEETCTRNRSLRFSALIDGAVALCHNDGVCLAKGAKKRKKRPNGR